VQNHSHIYDSAQGLLPLTNCKSEWQAHPQASMQSTTAAKAQIRSWLSMPGRIIGIKAALGLQG
jgi:hypothetical protein